MLFLRCWGSNCPLGRIDLKAIMAEAAQNSSRPSRPIPTPGGKTRVVGFQPADPQISIATTPPRDVKRPWGNVDPPVSTPSAGFSIYPALGAVTQGDSASSPRLARSSPPRRSVEALRTGPSTPSKLPLGSHLGPTINPTRMAAESSSRRPKT
jgi:hypothetical protein